MKPICVTLLAVVLYSATLSAKHVTTYTCGTDKTCKVETAASDTVLVSKIFPEQISDITPTDPNCKTTDDICATKSAASNIDVKGEATDIVKRVVFSDGGNTGTLYVVKAGETHECPVGLKCTDPAYIEKTANALTGGTFRLPFQTTQTAVTAELFKEDEAPAASDMYAKPTAAAACPGGKVCFYYLPGSTEVTIEGQTNFKTASKIEFTINGAVTETTHLRSFADDKCAVTLCTTPAHVMLNRGSGQLTKTIVSLGTAPTTSLEAKLYNQDSAPTEDAIGPQSANTCENGKICYEYTKGGTEVTISNKQVGNRIEFTLNTNEKMNVYLRTTGSQDTSCPSPPCPQEHVVFYDSGSKDITPKIIDFKKDINSLTAEVFDETYPTASTAVTALSAFAACKADTVCVGKEPGSRYISIGGTSTVTDLTEIIFEYDQQVVKTLVKNVANPPCAPDCTIPPDIEMSALGVFTQTLLELPSVPTGPVTVKFRNAQGDQAPAQADVDATAACAGNTFCFRHRPGSKRLYVMGTSTDANDLERISFTNAGVKTNTYLRATAAPNKECIEPPCTKLPYVEITGGALTPSMIEFDAEIKTLSGVVMKKTAALQRDSIGPKPPYVCTPGTNLCYEYDSAQHQITITGPSTLKEAGMIQVTLDDGTIDNIFIRSNQNDNECPIPTCVGPIVIDRETGAISSGGPITLTKASASVTVELFDVSKTPEANAVDKLNPPACPENKICSWPTHDPLKLIFGGKSSDKKIVKMAIDVGASTDKETTFFGDSGNNPNCGSLTCTSPSSIVIDRDTGEIEQTILTFATKPKDPIVAAFTTIKEVSDAGLIEKLATGVTCTSGKLCYTVGTDTNVAQFEGLVTQAKEFTVNLAGDIKWIFKFSSGDKIFASATVLIGYTLAMLLTM